MDLSTLRGLARNKADETNTDFVGNSELNQYLNQGLRFIYGKIVQRYENYFIVKGSNGSSYTNFATTDVDTATEQITVTQSFQTSDPILFKSTGTLPAGLTAATTYYAIRVSSTVIKVATTIANSVAGTAINLTSVGSGTHSIGHSGFFDTVSGTQEYPLPADLMKFVRVEHRQSGSTNEDDFLSLQTLNISNDRVRTFYPPREGWGPGPGFGYFIAGNRLYLRPTPTSTFQIRLWYVPRVQSLSSDTDVPGIPEEYHEILAEYAAIQVLAKSGEGIWKERSDVFQVELTNLLETIEIRNQQSEQMIITDEWSFDVTGFSAP